MDGTQIKYEMEDVANDYLNLLNCQENRLHSTRRMEQETQGFWESENLVLERQNQMGIDMVLELAPHDWKGEFSCSLDHRGEVTLSKIGDNYAGVSQRIVDVNRKIYRNGKCIKTYKDICDCRVNLLKNDVNDENMVACPNCGGFGTIESYADGCDFCGSKFSVNYFKSKVSGFSLIEDLSLKVNGWRNRAFKGYIIIFILVFCANFLSIGMGGFGHILFNNPYPSVDRMMTSMMIAQGTMLLLPKLFFMVFLLFAGTIFVFRNKKTYNSQELAYGVIPEFNEYEFAQELEHRLKCLMMADNSTQLELISDCESWAFTECHRDVFDLTVSSIKFISVRYNPQTEDDCVTVEAMVKLYRNSGKSVKESYERITLNMAKHRTATMNQRVNLRQYKCPSCGNNINIFKGCTCEFCHNRMDKFSLGWVVQGISYTPAQNLYRLIPVVAGVIALIIFIL